MTRKQVFRVVEGFGSMALAAPLVLHFYAAQELLAAFILFSIGCIVIALLGLALIFIDAIGRALLRPANFNIQIAKALKPAAEVEANRISVETRDGKMILRRHAKSWVDREQAERVALAAPSVPDAASSIEIA